MRNREEPKLKAECACWQPPPEEGKKELPLSNNSRTAKYGVECSNHQTKTVFCYLLYTWNFFLTRNDQKIMILPNFYQGQRKN